MKIIIFGASEGGKNFFNTVKRRSVIGFCDNDVNKHGKKILGKRIYAPSELDELSFDCIVIASMYSGDIYKQLSQIGFDAQKIMVPDIEILSDSWEFPWLEIIEFCRALLRPFVVLVCLSSVIYLIVQAIL